MSELTRDQKWLLNHVVECDGAELPKSWWRDANVLEHKGLITLSSVRGPGSGFRRAKPVVQSVAEAQGFI